VLAPVADFDNRLWRTADIGAARMSRRRGLTVGAPSYYQNVSVVLFQL